VTCSRAEGSLALLVYAQNANAVRDAAIRKGRFADDEVILL